MLEQSFTANMPLQLYKIEWATVILNNATYSVSMAFVFLPRDSYAKRGICRHRVSVCLSVRHTPVLYQNG